VWPAHRHESGPALTSAEQRRFEEIARLIDQDAAAKVDELPIPPTTAVIPVRLAALGLFVVGVTGVLTGLARGDAVVLAVVGIVPAASAVVLAALTWVPGRAEPPVGSPFTRFWSWLTTCAENGCGNHPVHLGWCSEHAPRHDPAPDEYWSDAG
jgi:hypothetical protein